MKYLIGENTPSLENLSEEEIFNKFIDESFYLVWKKHIEHELNKYTGIPITHQNKVYPITPDII